MLFKVTRERLTKAGFKLEKCEDGTFWVLEKEAGEEAERILRICDRAIIDFDAEAVKDIVVLQCDYDLSDPALCIDNYLWRLSRRDFRDIVFLLLRDRKARAKTPPAAGTSQKP